MACGTWAGWFKCQVIEQQTRIKTLLMSSEFHLGSIRRLVEAEANTCSRERLRGREMRGYWTASPQNREDTGLCLSKSGLRVNSCKQQQLEDFIQRGGRISSYGDVRIRKWAVFVNQLEMMPDYRWELDVNVDHWEIKIWVSKYFLRWNLNSQVSSLSQKLHRLQVNVWKLVSEGTVNWKSLA